MNLYDLLEDDFVTSEDAKNNYKYPVFPKEH